jgi:aspartate/methionine/tyrosine aminotransferase
MVSRAPLVYRKTAYVKRQCPIGSHPSSEGLIECTNNPDIINLGTAENHLIEDVLLPIFQSRPTQPAESLFYRAGENDLPLRTAFAQLLRDHFGLKNADASKVLIGPGISFFADRGGCGILNPEDSFMMTCPYYGPIPAVLAISGAECVPIDIENLPPAPPENARLLQLVNPGNPVGELVPNIGKLLKWAHQKADLHIICDEIYALSNRRGLPFQSLAAHPDADPQRVHTVYSLSKDWGLGGLHLGCFYTQNRGIYEMMKRVSGPARVSSDTQWIGLRILKDVTARDEILRVTVERMRESERLLIEMLKEANIRFIPVDYCPFVVIDLSDIAGESLEQELSVWRELRDRYRVHVMPGEGCFHFRTGWFRLCFGLPAEILKAGVRRLIGAIGELRDQRRRVEQHLRIPPQSPDRSEGAQSQAVQQM